MPFYKVWYSNKTEPLEFSTAGRCREEEIVDRILAEEHIVAHEIADANRGDAGGPGPSLKEIIARNNLAPVRYAEDEGEPYTIG